MKLKQVLQLIKLENSKVGGLWSSVCENFYETVAQIYPDLVEANINAAGKATIDLLETGNTDDSEIEKSDYPELPISSTEDPFFYALYEVGAIRFDTSGKLVVEPTPSALIRGLLRLALPKRTLFDIVNEARKLHQKSELSLSEFEDLDREIFGCVRRNVSIALGEKWPNILLATADLLNRTLILPCTKFKTAQGFYENARDFYGNHDAQSDKIFIYSTTSGIVIPGEYNGDVSNPNEQYTARYTYFQRLLKHDSCSIHYQWERNRTARAIAKEYSESEDKEEYFKNAYETLRLFANKDKMAIFETDNFEPWKNWQTLVGPKWQMLSVRDTDKRLKIGRGVAYDIKGIQSRKDWQKNLLLILSASGLRFSNDNDFLMNLTPALMAIGAFGLLKNYSTGEMANFLSKSPLDKSIQELSPENREKKGIRVIKPFDVTLKDDQIKVIVDDLIVTGNKILEFEGKPNDGQGK